MGKAKLLAASLLGLLLACGTHRPGAPVAAEPSKVDEVLSPLRPLSPDGAFWSVWGDGQAELSGYDLVFPKYKQRRKGVAVAIFVTEPFSNSARVKADPGKHAPRDEFPVMKLNLVKDYPTGIYDYNEMLSSFVALAPVNQRAAGTLTKVSFSSQEWCGHVYSQMLFDPLKVRLAGHSYFDGEADRQVDLDYPAGGIGEDALWLWARGMAQPVLTPGDSATVPMLMSLAASRDKHQPVFWKPVTLKRLPGSRKIVVAGAGIEVEEVTAESAWGKNTFLVEKAMPRRVVQYESSAGEKATLLKTARLKYWQMNHPAGEAALKQLGLAPRPARTN